MFNDNKKLFVILRITIIALVVVLIIGIAIVIKDGENYNNKNEQKNTVLQESSIESESINEIINSNN